jgi:hypothetical protein
MQDDIRVHYKPVTLLSIQLGMLCKPLVWKYRSEPRELITKVTSLESTRYIITDISFTQD